MIRGFLTVLASVALFLSLFLLGMSWDLSSSLNYQNVQENSVALASNLFGPQINLTSEIEQYRPILKQYCNFNSAVTVPVQGYNLSISCNGINSKSASEILNETMAAFADKVYHADYNCSYWHCFSQSAIPMFLVSQKSRDYWRGILRWSLLASLVVIGALFILLKKKQNLPFTVGITMALSAIPLLGMQKLLQILPSNAASVAGIFLSKSGWIFWVMIAISATLIFAGLIIKLFEAESWLYDFLSRFKEKFKKEKTTKEEPKEKTSQKPKLQKTKEPEKKKK